MCLCENEETEQRFSMLENDGENREGTVWLSHTKTNRTSALVLTLNYSSQTTESAPPKFVVVCSSRTVAACGQ